MGRKEKDKKKDKDMPDDIDDVPAADKEPVTVSFAVDPAIRS